MEERRELGEDSGAMVEGAGLYEPELKGSQRRRSGTARSLGPKETVCRKGGHRERGSGGQGAL